MTIEPEFIPPASTWGGVPRAPHHRTRALILRRLSVPGQARGQRALLAPC